MQGPDDYSDEDWEPDGTGIYEGENSAIIYDTDGDQHTIMDEGDE